MKTTKTPKIKMKRKAAEPTTDAAAPAYPCQKLEQNGHTLYLLSIPIDDLQDCCFVDRREDGSSRGFQRHLDEKRADAIAEYLADGRGIIPSCIVLAAQEAAHLEYNRGNKSLSFKRTPKAFFVMDGQHRLFGYEKCTTRHRVPVMICADLDVAQQAQCFIDVNTKQKPVPASLLLDIKQLAQTENEREAELRGLYDRLGSDPLSPLREHLSPTGADRTKLSRVTFNRVVGPLLKTALRDVSGMVRYELLRSYLRVIIERYGAEEAIRPAVLAACGQVMRDALEVCAAQHDDVRLGSLRKTLGCFAGVALRDADKRAYGASDLAEAMRTALRPPLKITSAQVDERITTEQLDEQVAREQAEAS